MLLRGPISGFLDQSRGTARQAKSYCVRVELGALWRYDSVTLIRISSMLSEQRLEAIMARRFAGLLLCQIAALFALAVLLVRPDVSMAQAAARYDVTGFRDARFGMTEQEVRARARDSFDAKDDEM